MHDLSCIEYCISGAGLYHFTAFSRILPWKLEIYPGTVLCLFVLFDVANVPGCRTVSETYSLSLPPLLSRDSFCSDIVYDRRLTGKREIYRFEGQIPCDCKYILVCLYPASGACALSSGKSTPTPHSSTPTSSHLMYAEGVDLDACAWVSGEKPR